MTISLIIKALIGAVIVVIIDLLSRTKYAFLAGMLPLFPAFMIISHYLVARNRPADLGSTVVFGVFSLIPYLLYLGTVFLLHSRWTIVPVLLAAAGAWLLGAMVLVLSWPRTAA